MWVLRIWVLTVLLAVTWSVPAKAEFDIKKVDKSVIRIFAKGRKAGRMVSWSGSGFVINDQGYVATNNHVVANATELIVPDGSYKNLRRATVVWADPNVDLAVIRVDGLNRPLVPLSIPEPAKGTPAYAVGYPGHGDGFERAAKKRPSLESTVTAGVIGKVFDGAHSRNPETVRRMVQHNAEINPGNSGGPLFNACNQVVAINTYGKKALLQIRRHPQTGKPIAIGSFPSGIFAGSHVSVLIKNLKSRNIAFTPAQEICKFTGGGTTIIRQVGKMPIEMYVYIAAAFLVGTAGIALALRKPRERIVKVVESYSQMLRRKGGAGAASAPGAVAAGTATPEASRSRPQPAGGAAPATARGSGWLLSGFDRNGHSIQILLTDSELERSERGRVIGRKTQLVHHVITDRSVSRRHARFVPLDDGIGVVDLNSTHGTFIDDEQIPAYGEPVLLKPGSELKLGGVALKIGRQK